MIYHQNPFYHFTGDLFVRVSCDVCDRVRAKDWVCVCVLVHTRWNAYALSYNNSSLDAKAHTTRTHIQYKYIRNSKNSDTESTAKERSACNMEKYLDTTFTYVDYINIELKEEFDSRISRAKKGNQVIDEEEKGGDIVVVMWCNSIVSPFVSFLKPTATKNEYMNCQKEEEREKRCTCFASRKYIG